MGDTSDDLAGLTIFHKLVLVLALISGAGNGAMGVFSPKVSHQDVSDRYRGADAVRDFQARDKRIDGLELYRRSHEKESSKYIEKIESIYGLVNKVPPAEINRIIRELERRVHNLEVENARHWDKD